MSKPMMQPVKPPKMTETADRKAGRSPFTFDLIPGSSIDEYAAPYLIGLMLVPAAGWVAHRYWHGGYAVVFPLLLIGGAAVMSHWVSEDMAARKRLVRVRVYASIWAVFLSVILSTWIGPWTRPWLDLQVVGTVVLCGTWTIGTFRAVRGEGQDAHPRDSLADQLGLPGMTADKRSDENGRRVFGLFHPNNTSAQVQKALDLLAVKLRTRSVRITEDPQAPNDPSRSELTILDRDVLAEPVWWPGPSVVGGSVAEPCVIGVRASGKPLEILRPGDPDVPRANQMILVGGQPGTGKTQFATLELAELCTRRDVVVFWSDTEKWNTVRRMIGPAVAYAATTTEETRDMLMGLVRAVHVRVDVMAEHGFMEWTPAVYEQLGIPFIVANFEELSFVADVLQDELKDAVALVRSSGISILCSQQRNSGSNIPTDIRALFGIGVMFGCNSLVDAKFVLSDETVDAGAAPERWGTRHPGRCFVEASHEPVSQWSEEGRTFRIAPSRLAEHVSQYGPGMARLDPWTVRALGTEYETARRRCETRRDETAIRDETRRDGVARRDETRRETRDDMKIRDAIRDAIGDETVPDENRRTPLRYDRSETAGVRLGDETAMSSAERDAAFRDVLAVLLGEADSVEISTEQIMAGMMERGMLPHQKPSVHLRLRRALADQTMVRLGLGRYRLLPVPTNSSGRRDAE